MPRRLARGRLVLAVAALVMVGLLRRRVTAALVAFGVAVESLTAAHRGE